MAISWQDLSPADDNEGASSFPINGLADPPSGERPSAWLHDGVQTRNHPQHLYFDAAAGRKLADINGGSFPSKSLAIAVRKNSPSLERRVGHFATWPRFGYF